MYSGVCSVLGLFTSCLQDSETETSVLHETPCFNGKLSLCSSVYKLVS